MDINKFHLEKYNEALIKAKQLKIRKMHDYNSGKITRFDYALHGNQSFVDEIYKKTLRLVSLTDNKSKPKNESIEDTLLDIINYSADFYSYILYIKQKQEK